MRFRDTVKMSLVGLSTHKSRSGLTILGIVIGITSIILVMSIGQSAEQFIVGEVQGLGSTNVYIIPGREPSGPTDAGGSLINDSIKIRDIEDLKKRSNVPDAVRIVPLVFGPVVASYQAEAYSTTVLGGPQDIFDIYQLTPARGDFFQTEDVTGHSEVVVIGIKVAEELFGLSDPVGEKIKIKNKTYRVIGLLEKKGQSPFVNFDESIIMPYTTVQQYVLGIRYIQRVVVEARTPADIDNVVKDITILLRNNHNITDPEKDDFFVQTQADLVDTLSTITTVLTLLLSSVAGVGIMNIMLVSVTERTREIGLRKALGATNGNILSQFLVEAVVLTISGGIIGIILGTLLSWLVALVANRAFALDFPFAFSVTGLMLGVGVSTAIGLVFGIFPARQAAKKSPIEALRYE